MKIKISILLFFFTSALYAQVAPTKYWIQFTDKNNNPFSVFNPSAFLSQKAIERRTKQNINIQFNDLPVTPAYLDSIKNTGAIILNPSKWLNGVTIQTADSVVLQKIQNFSFVQKTVPVQKKADALIPLSNKFSNSLIPSEASYKMQNYNYGASTNQIDMVGGIGLHDSGYWGQGMTIALLDAGFRMVDTLEIFDSLRINHQILGTKNFADSIDVYQLHPHGMATLSVMAANSDGLLIGTAPKANYWLLRSEVTPTENIIEEYNWVSAAEFADSVGADIISSSLGYNTFDNPSQNHSYSDMNGHTTPITIGANVAASKGMLVVSSAGNEGGTSWRHITAPADGDGVLAVGAVDENMTYASLSSQGPSFDGRIKPDVAAQGVSTVVASLYGGTTAETGTSLSCPIIAGLAACLWQAHPNLTNIQIKNAIIQSANRFNNPDSLTGYGIPNFFIANILLSDVDFHIPSADNITRIYSNPFRQNISFEFYSDTSQNLTMELYDALGNKILTQEKKLFTNSINEIFLVNTEHLSNGMYFLRVVSLKNQFIRKLIKI